MKKKDYQKIDKQQTKEIISDEEKDDRDDVEIDLGEYFLHVYLQYSQGLKLSDISDVKVHIKALGESQYSNVQEKVVKSSKTFWGEHFFFSKKFDSRSELNNSFIEIIFYKHSKLPFANYMNLQESNIGAFSCSLLRIYAQKDHTILNQWNILTNP